MAVIEPKVNGYLLDAFNAHLVEYTVSPCDYKNGYVLPPSSIMPVKLDGTVGLRTVTIELDFDGDTMMDIELNISNMTAMLHQEAELLLPDGFYYTCVFDKATTPKEKAPWILRVKFSLEGVRHGAMHTETLTSSGKVFVGGNYKTSAVYKISPRSGTTTATVNGITVENMTGAVIIDGINKTVMQNGLNKFADTSMTEFPSLNVGYNDIVISGNVTVEVSYYPIYL